MSLSKKEGKTHGSAVKIDLALLAAELQSDCAEIVFALVLGSAAGGVVDPGSDLDIAVYLDTKPTGKMFLGMMESIENSVPGVEVDLGVLNGNEPVYRFEALKGRLLFTRDSETWLSFFSLTCREYEHWMYHYEKQRRYRIEFSRE